MCGEGRGQVESFQLRLKTLALNRKIESPFPGINLTFFTNLRIVSADDDASFGRNKRSTKRDRINFVRVPSFGNQRRQRGHQDGRVVQVLGSTAYNFFLLILTD